MEAPTAGRRALATLVVEIGFGNQVATVLLALGSHPVAPAFSGALRPIADNRE